MMIHIERRLLSAAMAVSLWGLVMLMPVNPVHADDSFYLPPESLPAGLPGDVIRSRPSLAGPPGARALADAWQVMYMSTDGLGNPAVVTGTVWYRKEKIRQRCPSLGWHRERQGLPFVARRPG